MTDEGGNGNSFNQSRQTRTEIDIARIQEDLRGAKRILEDHIVQTRLDRSETREWRLASDNMFKEFSKMFAEMRPKEGWILLEKHDSEIDKIKETQTRWSAYLGAFTALMAIGFPVLRDYVTYHIKGS
jgi:hypothetical protein